MSLPEQSDARLKRWRDLEEVLDSAHATRALREALHALEVIEGLGGTAGSMAAAGIARAWAEL